MTADDLTTLGLGRYQAQVLVAVMAATAPVNTVEIAEASGVPRTSVYAAARVLAAMGVIGELKAHGVQSWQPVGGWDAVIDVLDLAARSRLEAHLARSAALRSVPA